MARGGDNRGRLLLIILVITSLFLITLDLRGVSVIGGLKTGTQSALSPIQNVGSIVLSPVRNFFSDIIHLGRTRAEMEALREEMENFSLNCVSGAVLMHNSSSSKEH